MRSYSYILALFIILNNSVFAQFSQEKIDEVRAKLLPGVQDTLQSDYLLTIGREYLSYNIDSSRLYVTKSLEMSKAINDKYGIALAMNSLANCDWRSSKYDEALTKYLESITYLESANKKDRIPGVTNNIGLIYVEMGNYEKALEYFKLSLQQKKEHHLPASSIATSTNNIGNVYMDLGDLDNAIPYYEEAYKISSQSDDSYNTSLSIGNLATALRKKGELEKALKLHKEALQIDLDNEFNDMTPNSYSNVGTDYYEMHQYKEATQYYTLALQAAEEYGETAYIADIHKNLSESNEMLGKKDAALYHFKIYHDIQDSLLSSDMTEQMTEMQTRYETEKKELQINVLSKENQLKQTEIARQKFIRNSALTGGAILLLFLSIVFFQKRKISREKARSEELLLNILPYETAQELKEKGSSEAQLYDEVTVLFTDFKGFTSVAEMLSPKELVAEIHHCFMAFDHIMEKYGIEKIKTIGDAYMAAAGLPVINKTNPIDVVNAGLEIRDFMARYAVERLSKGMSIFEIRVGIHTGPVVAGIVGVKKFQYDIWGDTVNTASRMESSGRPGMINISETTYELVKDHFNCLPRGKIAAKNKGEIEMYFVESKA